MAPTETASADNDATMTAISVIATTESSSIRWSEQNRGDRGVPHELLDFFFRLTPASISKEAKGMAALVKRHELWGPICG
jgi:hypothetical protein